MKESRAKIAKQINADSIKEIKRALKININPEVTEVAISILDQLCMFIQASPDASFANEGQVIFESVDSFTQAMKGCDPAAMEKSWIQDIAESVNMKMDGEKGNLLKRVTNADNVNDMIIYFPYFKLLYKMCQLGMTLKKKQSLERKAENAKSETEQLQIKLTTAETISQNFDFHLRLSSEVERTN